MVQQQAIRGCTAATAAMLIQDHGRQPNIRQLKTRNMGDNSHQLRDIRAAGLTPIYTKLSNGISELEELLRTNDSSIVSFSDKDLGGHVVVVDEITAEDVRLREPYHGWEITVTRDAFMERFCADYAIQIR